MARIKSKKTKALILVENYIKKGYSANRIQQELKQKKLGFRRKRLLQEIRLIKKQIITPEKRKKHIPIKYKIPEKEPEKVDKIFRLSYIISSLPLHSRPFQRNYLGFRINAFCFDKDYLLLNKEHLRSILIRETSKYTSNFALFNVLDHPSCIVGYEPPTLILVSNPKSFNKYWFFSVEKDGSEQYSRMGQF